MTRWTPGPWKIERQTCYGWDIETADNQWLAVAHNSHNQPEGFPPDEAGKANAHLISAAPELYTALKEAIAWLPDSNPMQRKAREQASAALAKARGEQS